MSNALWQPKEPFQTQLGHWIQCLFENQQIHEPTYEALDLWSVERPELFWPACAEFLGIQWKSRFQQVLQTESSFQFSKWFIGGTLDFVSHFLKGDPEQLALIALNEAGEQVEWTYQELADQVARLAQGFLDLGVKKGDRVAAIVPNQWFSVVGFLATAAVGAIWSSCSPDFGVLGILDRFQQIKPKLLLTVGSYAYKGIEHSLIEKLEAILPSLPDCEQILWVGNASTLPRAPQKIVFWDQLIEQSSPLKTFHVAHFDDPLCVVYSSGTTGVPKCIVHGVGRVLLEHLKELRLHVDLKPADRFFYYTTCGWMMWNWWLSGLAVGATLISYDGHPFYPKITRLWDELARLNITVFGTSARFIMENAQSKVSFPPNALPSLRMILSTGSPLSAALFEYVYQSIAPRVLLGSISGGTDILGCFMLSNPMLPVYAGQLQSRSLGLAVDCYGENGQKAGEAERGELVCVEPFPSMPVCFWGDPKGELYHKAYFDHFPGVWSHGDWVYKTPEGGFVIEGRSDTVLNPGGIRIGTGEIYRAVEILDEIQEAVAVGVPYKNDVVVWLFVVLKPNFKWNSDLSKKIRLKIKTELSPRHVPRHIRVVGDIPKTLNGKKAENAVRQTLMGEAVTNLQALANPESLLFFH